MTGSDFRNGQDTGLVGAFIARITGFILAAVMLCVAGMTSARADNPQRHIVIVETMTLPVVQLISDRYRHHMAQLGYEDGQDIRYSVVNADGKPGKTTELLAALLEKEQPDLVLTIATLASREARNILKDGDVPQLFLLVTDPVKEGFVTAIGNASGSNLAGHTHNLAVATKISMVDQVIGKRPAAWNIGLLYSTYPSAEADARRLIQAQHDHDGINFIPLHFRYSPGEDGKALMTQSALDAIDKNNSPIDALWIATGPASNDPQFVQGIARSGLPVLYAENMTSVKAGALLALLSPPDLNAETGGAITRAIFSGTTAGNIPVVRPERFLLGVNIRTAQSMEITIPSHILELAGENVFK